MGELVVSGMNRRIKEVAVRTETDLREVDRREKAPSKVRNIKGKKVTLGCLLEVSLTVVCCHAMLLMKFSVA